MFSKLLKYLYVLLSSFLSLIVSCVITSIACSPSASPRLIEEFKSPSKLASPASIKMSDGFVSSTVIIRVASDAISLKTGKPTGTNVSIKNIHTIRVKIVVPANLPSSFSYIFLKNMTTILAPTNNAITPANAQYTFQIHLKSYKLIL